MHNEPLGQNRYPIIKCTAPKQGIYKIDDESITFGKSPRADIMVQGLFVSDIHTCIGRTDNGYVIVNMGRTKKTRLNGRIIKRSLIRSGDCFQIGSSSFIFLQ